MNEHECNDVFARLSEYLDRELPPATCDEISRHIADCEPCVKFVESLRKSVSLTRAFHAEEAPAPLTPEAKEELRRAFERMRKQRP